MINNKKVVLCSIVSICIILSAMLLSCGGSPNKEKERSSNEPVKLNIGITKTDTGQRAFDISIEEFIKSFNSYYENDNGEQFLGTIDKWQMYDVAPTVHNKNVTTCYAFSEDPSIRALPQLKIHADSTKSCIYQISICYDFHSFSPETYDMYSELNYYVMRMMLSDVTKEEVKNIRDTALDSLDENFAMNKSQAEHDYELVFAKGNIGIYPYYVAGDTAEIRIIPVE